MKKNNINNKEHYTNSNYDYLNFIRKNQQIVQQFKEIAHIDRKANSIKKIFTGPGYQQTGSTIQADRYSELPYNFQDSLFNYRQRAKFQITSLKQAFHTSKREIDYSCKQKTSCNDINKPANSQFYSRNLKIPQKAQKTKNTDTQQKLLIHEAISQVKFPKVKTKRTFEQDGRSNSDSSLSMNAEKQTYTEKQNKKIQRFNDEWKKNYAPISLDATKNKNIQSPTRCKIKSLKLKDIAVHKINEKLVRTYYDYQNLVQLKQRVAELLPTFKPLQSKKKQRINVVQSQLQSKRHQFQQYLQNNTIAKSHKITERSEKILDRNKGKSQTPGVDSTDQKNQAVQQMPQQNQQFPLLHAQSEIIQDKKQQQNEEKQTIQKSQTISPSKNLRIKKEIKVPQNLGLNAQEQTVYQNKIQSYRQFLFQVNFAHRVFDPLILKDDPDKHRAQNKYKYYIGPGNNSLLVKSLMKRRFWWVQVDDPKQANFVWTQLKINSYYQFEPKSKITNCYDKLDSQHNYVLPKKKVPKSKSILDNNKKQDQMKIGGILRAQLPDGQKKIFTNADNLYLSSMIQKAIQQNPQMKNFNKFQNRLRFFPQNFLHKREEDYKQIRMHNHLFFNYEIGNKKALFYNLKHFYEIKGVNPWNSLPLTFHIKKGINDPQYNKFMKQYKKIKSELDKAQKNSSPKKKLSRNVWIVKPGELSNRGNGITVIDEIYELNTIIKSREKHNNGIQKTYIVQKYIQKPMLYKNRKFDIRHYMMISRLHGRMRAYWFSQGYIRTSSCQYNIEEVGDVMIHLTNDAIQKHSSTYGKYQQGNKLSYAQFQRYIDNTYPQKKYSFMDSIYPRMKQIASDAVKSTYLWMDPDRFEHNFEVFGLDFMIDANFDVWLIQVNTNPCLQLSSGLLGRIIPTMIENSIRLALDPIFPPTAQYLNTIKYLAPDSPMERLQFQLIFDEARDGQEIEELMKKNGKANCGEIQQQDETYEGDGKEIQLGEDQ